MAYGTGYSETILVHHLRVGDRVPPGRHASRARRPHRCSSCGTLPPPATDATSKMLSPIAAVTEVGNCCLNDLV